MVPAQAGADGPLAEADEVFDEGGGFEVEVGGEEGCGGRGRAIVELGGVGDGVGKVFVQEDGVGFDAALELLIAVVQRVGGFEVALAEVVVLGGEDGG